MAKSEEWHLGHLDALRGLAVTGVILVHSMGTGRGLGRTTGEICFSGQRGVQLFFVVSAFTLFLSYTNRRNETSPTRNFFLRRLFRLSPMFYVAVVLSRTVPPYIKAAPLPTLSSLLYLNGFSPSAIHAGAAGSWSVTDEALFYLALPLLFHWIRDLRTALTWLTVSVPVCFVTSTLLSRHWPQYDTFFFFFGMTTEWAVFLLGITAFFVWKECLSGLWDSATRKIVSATALLLLVLVYFGELPFTNRNLFGTSALCAALVLVLSLHPWALLVNRVTILLGRLSYSIYLLHFAVIYAVQLLLARAAVQYMFARHPLVQLGLCFWATLLLSGAFAVITWRFIETPGIQLGRRVIAWLEHRNMRLRESDAIPALLGQQNTSDAQV